MFRIAVLLLGAAPFAAWYGWLAGWPRLQRRAAGNLAASLLIGLVVAMPGLLDLQGWPALALGVVALPFWLPVGVFDTYFIRCVECSPPAFFRTMLLVVPFWFALLTFSAAVTVRRKRPGDTTVATA